MIVELPIRQYQVTQKSMTEIEIKLVADRPLTKNEEDGFSDFITRSLRYSFLVSIVYVDEIPRGPGGKFEIFRCEVATS